MLDYFLSSDWAIIATELLAGFIVISLILAILVWRGQRRHTGAAERLLDDRAPIMRASEEMLDRQIQRTWPELTIDDEQRESYAERSLDAVEAMVEPWLEPKRYELAAVARRFLQVRQADLDQLLTLARAQAEQSEGDDPRLAELEKDIEELRDQRDRQAKHLAESLETVNVMVREYGRKFDYNNEPRVATVLKAIVMVQEMDAGADCETAKSRADEVFTEDLVATPSTPAEESEPSPAAGEDSPAATGAQPVEETDTDADTPDLSAEDEMAAAMAAEGVSNEKTEAMEAASREREEQATAEAQATTGTDTADDPETDERTAEQTTDELTGVQAEEQGIDSTAEPDTTVANSDDLDELIESAAKAQPGAQPEPPESQRIDGPTRAEEAETTGPDEEVAQPSGEGQPDEKETSPSSIDGEDQEIASARPDEPEVPGETSASPEETESRQDERRDDGQEEGDNGVIDLDDVEIPKEDEKDKDDGKDQEFDLDDIDALLDAEIARKHGKGND
ncbi:hypothetical protein [Guyparkeria sp. TX1]|uniref:hypothetical protein n=1 Tax=Guyparkeria sp. TX1 TaxID=3115001 RepID=UPI003977D942